MKELTIEAKTEKLDEVLAFQEMFLDEIGCTPKAGMQLAIAMEEMFVNIAHYAYEKTGVPESERLAQIRLEETSYEGKKAVRVRLSDGGVPYNPLAKEDPDTTLSAEERPIGGLGIYMVKKSMDDVAYEYLDGKNVFTMIKVVS